jgi:hypothetical protein
VVPSALNQPEGPVFSRVSEMEATGTQSMCVGLRTSAGPSNRLWVCGAEILDDFPYQGRDSAGVNIEWVEDLDLAIELKPRVIKTGRFRVPQEQPHDRTV